MPRKRNVYLEDLPMSEAVARINAALAAAGLWQPFPHKDVL